MRKEGMEKEKFHQRIKGPMNNYEDWYHLVKAEDGQLHVEHSWSYVSPSLKGDDGTQTYTVDEFMQSKGVDAAAKVALEKWLTKT
jgi:hypothetical protein